MDSPRTGTWRLRSVGLRRPELLTAPELAVLAGRSDLLMFAPDPDEACLALQRLVGISPQVAETINGVLQGDYHQAGRLLAVLGGSRALADYLISHPDALQGIFRSGCRETFTKDGYKPDAEADAVGEEAFLFHREMAKAVGLSEPFAVVSEALTAEPAADTEFPIAAVDKNADDLRRAYRSLLLGIAADDLTHGAPEDYISVVSRRLTALTDATLQAALALARREVDPDKRVCLSVISMGKTGAKELNYISDVDVVYVIEPGPAGQDLPEAELIDIGSRLATATAAACSGAGAEPPLWPVDAALRPEGNAGALVRTLESYRLYYERWAQTWEFQALLKARPCAGSTQLGKRFQELAEPLVWNAATRAKFVEETRAMRRRVEENIPRADTDRQLKLGPGGLRDVEFTAQLLQLVHGRTDESVRQPHTLTAINLLCEAGYIGRDGAGSLSSCYRFLRLLEHRAQLFRMRRTHLLPEDETSLTRIGRGLGDKSLTATEINNKWERIRTEVRKLHEELFYRPLLPAMANLDAAQVTLSPQAAAIRLEAIGYVDPEGALRHIQALSEGVSRRAAIQRQLLPVMLGWLADGPNPDAGLLAFRRVSDKIGRSHWYLGLLRDSLYAARRLCKVLSTSQWAGTALEEIPEAVRWLDNDEDLRARPLQQLETELWALIDRHLDPVEAAMRVRAVRYRELTRCALADCIDGVQARRSAAAIADINQAALQALLAISVRSHCEDCYRDNQQKNEVTSGEDPVDSQEFLNENSPIALIGMGRFGGAEPGYASDADVICIHRGDGSEDTELALRILNTLRELCSAPGPHPPLALDMDLRPEGRSGALSRTIEAYREYYSRWSSPWERQALLRARPVAGNRKLAREFIEFINPIRYGPAPDINDLTQIRRLKARMETERLPRGYDPKKHVKLGPGGLSDVEWTVQLLQLRHAHDFVDLQVTGTIKGIEAARLHDLLTEEQAETLKEAWLLASRIRAANTLATGRLSGPKLDVLPRSVAEQVQVGRLLGYPPGSERDLEEAYLRIARRARAVTEEIFYG